MLVVYNVGGIRWGNAVQRAPGRTYSSAAQEFTTVRHSNIGLVSKVF